jgi:CheY-like chemotaxis protein
MSYILLVEDNQANADMMIRLLTSEGYTVKHCTRALEGAQVARKERPDLILMDFDLPDINGRLMVLTLKKQLGDTKAPPFVAVTAHNTDVERQLAKRFGCSAFVSKPFDPQEFLTLVKQILAKTEVKS